MGMAQPRQKKQLSSLEGARRALPPQLHCKCCRISCSHFLSCSFFTTSTYAGKWKTFTVFRFFCQKNTCNHIFAVARNKYRILIYQQECAFITFRAASMTFSFKLSGFTTVNFPLCSSIRCTRISCGATGIFISLNMGSSVSQMIS